MRLILQGRLNSLLRWCSRVCLAGGAVALASYAYLEAKAYIYQRVQTRHFQVSAERQAEPTQENCPSPALITGEPIGRIEIPRIGLSVIAVEGDDDRVLRLGAGRVPGTARPGEVGNLAIAAHRDTFFRGLKDIRMDDVIQLITAGGTYIYRVESTLIVKPDRIDVLDATAKPTLTLITCYPFYYVGPAPKRFIVRARLVSADARSASGECFSPRKHG
jgi:sortase A